MQERRRSKHTQSFLERLAEHANKVRSKAESLPAGREREAMLEKLKQAERATQISRWLSSTDAAEPPEELGLFK
jgi:hypothetical protein